MTKSIFILLFLPWISFSQQKIGNAEKALSPKAIEALRGLDSTNFEGFRSNFITRETLYEMIDGMEVSENRRQAQSRQCLNRK